MWKHDRSSPDFDYEAWKKKHSAYANEVVPGWVEAVKSQFGKPTTKFACVGYVSIVVGRANGNLFLTTTDTASVRHMSATS